MRIFDLIDSINKTFDGSAFSAEEMKHDKFDCDIDILMRALVQAQQKLETTINALEKLRERAQTIALDPIGQQKQTVAFAAAHDLTGHIKTRQTEHQGTKYSFNSSSVNAALRKLKIELKISNIGINALTEIYNHRGKDGEKTNVTVFHNPPPDDFIKSLRTGMPYGRAKEQIEVHLAYQASQLNGPA